MDKHNKASRIRKTMQARKSPNERWSLVSPVESPVPMTISTASRGHKSDGSWQLGASEKNSTQGKHWKAKANKENNMESPPSLFNRKDEENSEENMQCMQYL